MKSASHAIDGLSKTDYHVKHWFGELSRPSGKTIYDVCVKRFIVNRKSINLWQRYIYICVCVCKSIMIFIDLDFLIRLKKKETKFTRLMIKD